MNENDINSIINNFKKMINDNNVKSTTQNNVNSGSTPSNQSINKNNVTSDSNNTISSEMINNLINSFKENDSKSNTENTNSSNNFNNLDFETILKLKSVMDVLNKKNDPRSKLLYSLKPYLRESRQKKIDQYANLLKITEVTNLFKNEKGENK